MDQTVTGSPRGPRAHPPTRPAPRDAVPAAPRPRRPRALAVVLLGVLSLLTGALSAATGTATASLPPAPSALAVSPTSYVGGQAVTWTGSLGVAGPRALVLEHHMGRPGDAWVTEPGVVGTSALDGSFSFVHEAPSMMNIHYRVRGGSAVSAPLTFLAKTQDLTIRVAGTRADAANPPGRVEAGRPFAIAVDTTPDELRGPTSRGLPVFEGRTLTLQRRVDADTWDTLATTTVPADGATRFTDLEADAGVVVYRVRAEDHRTGGHRIGWTQSFPLYVLVGEQAQQAWDRDHPTTTSPRPSYVGAAAAAPTRAATAGRALQAAPGATAGQRLRWFPALFDFAWEFGQSLTSLPARGTRLAGGWVDHSEGAGRVSKVNGGLAIDSKRLATAGPGDFGTTRATLRGNAMTYGRWEARMRVRDAAERTGHPYDVLAELVPAAVGDQDCGAGTIRLARISPFSRVVRFGAQSAQHRWSGRVTGPDTPTRFAYAVAVEVGRDHVTWFVNGVPVGTVTGEEVVPGVPLTLRLSLVGDGTQEMDHTGLISDWQRGFPITTGEETLSRDRLPRRAVAARC